MRIIFSPRMGLRYRRAAAGQGWPQLQPSLFRGFIRIMTKLTLAALLGAGLTLAACMPYDYGYNEAAMYSPGGALADKHTGPILLASSTDASLDAMFPKGTAKSQVLQVLGNPASSSSSSDGTSNQIFSHNFTSYRMKSVQIETLIVEYDRANTVQKLTFSKSTSTW